MWGWRIVRVSGHSMSPVLEQGDFVLMRGVTRRSKLQIGDVILLRHARFGDMIKQICALSEGVLRVEGASDESVTSEQIGDVARNDVLAKLVWRIRPAGARRLTPSQ